MAGLESARKRPRPASDEAAAGGSAEAPSAAAAAAAATAAPASSSPRRAVSSPDEQRLRVECEALRARAETFRLRCEQLTLERDQARHQARAIQVEEAKKTEAWRVKVTFLLEEEKRRKSEFDAKEKECETLRAQLRAEQAGRIKETRTQDADESARAALDAEVATLRHSEEILRASLRAKDAEIAALNEALEAARAAAKSNALPPSSAAELVKARAQVQALELELAGLRDAQTLIASLREANAERAQLEAGNRLLVEEARSLKRDLAEMAKLREEVVSLRAQKDRLRVAAESNAAEAAKSASLARQLDAWTSELSAIFLDAQPRAVAVAVRELQAELQRTAAELATARASAAALSARSADAAASQASQQTAMASLRDQLAAATEATQRAERRERLLVKERDGLKAIINAYDEELRGQIGEASSARIKALEAAQAEMEKELQRLRGVESQLRAAAEEREQRDRTIAMLEAELAAFERRFGQSEYAPSAAKVLHMSANPQTQAMAAQLREARAEIATLKQQLAVAGAAKPAAAAAAAAAAASSAVSASSEELEALRSEMVRWRDKAQSEEKSRARLKETFTTTVATFRDLCSQLVGFRIDMKGDNKVQVRSVYSADVKEVLLFQFEPPSKLTSLDSPFARQLPPDVLAYMTKMGSIPAFLAQLTLHLFSQTTVMSSAPRS